MRRFSLALTLLLASAAVADAGPIRNLVNRLRPHRQTTAEPPLARQSRTAPVVRATAAPAATGNCANGACRIR